MVKTVILNGTEFMVSGPDGDNAEIHNFSTDTVYASKFPNISENADNVIAVAAGAIDGLTGTGGKIYLLGLGKVQVNFTDEKITKTSAAVQSVENGGSGVSAEYVDEKNTETLAAAKEYTDENDAENLTAAKEYADMLSSKLSGYIGYTENDIYGLEADFENCVFTRLAGAVGKTAGADFDTVRAYGGRRRCNLSDSGEVLAYYGDEGFKADGSNGQVMVEQPRFYYKVVPLKTEKIDGADGYHLRKARYYISDTPKAGFKVHPAFVSDGVEVDRIYLSAFEGCIYDTSAEAYLLNDEQVADFDADKLSSIAGAKPCSGQTQQLTRANAGKLAQNRTQEWSITTIQSFSATQMLFAVEYAVFNSQTGLGTGFQALNTAETIEKTGSTSSLGSASGKASNGMISYRGEENFWGNIWTWCNGMNMYNSNNDYGLCYISNHDFCDDSPSALSAVALNHHGYVSAFQYSNALDWLFLPTEAKGNSSSVIGDYWRNPIKSTWRIAMVGSGGTHEQGAFAISFSHAKNVYLPYIGARLTYIPLSTQVDF